MRREGGWGGAREGIVIISKESKTVLNQSLVGILTVVVFLDFLNAFSASFFALSF
jgi:hypothetical protein